MSGEAGWRYILSSARGFSHVLNDDPCQDALNCEVIDSVCDGPVLVALVSDGAGSSKRGEIGAWLACRHFTAEIEQYFDRGCRLRDLQLQTVLGWLAGFHTSAGALAERERNAIHDYSCTLLGAVIGRSDSAFFQIGDGAIVVGCEGSPDQLRVVNWPQRGEYHNVTHFATSRTAANRLQFSMGIEPIEDLAIFSDGIERLVLDIPGQAAHQPWFSPKLEALRERPEGYQPDLSYRMYNYFDSPVVNNGKFPDDKTLILASRRAPSGNAYDERRSNGDDDPS